MKKTKTNAGSIWNVIFVLVGVILVTALEVRTGASMEAREKGGLLIIAALFIWGLTGRLAAYQTIKVMTKAYEKKNFIDEGTGALSKSRLLEVLTHEIKTSKRKKAPLSVVLVEMLNVVEINKEFDRLEGDLSLAAVALGTQKCLRDTDYLGRISVLTFCVILPDSTAEQSMIVASRITKSLSDIVRSHPKGEVHISVHVSQNTWNGTDEAEEFILHAQHSSLI